MWCVLLCVQPIPILSAFFLCHPYIPLSNLKNFSFTSNYLHADNMTYLLFANSSHINRASLDGSSFETLYSGNSTDGIRGVDYHYRLVLCNISFLVITYILDILPYIATPDLYDYTFLVDNSNNYYY